VPKFGVLKLLTRGAIDPLRRPWERPQAPVGPQAALGAPSGAGGPSGQALATAVRAWSDGETGDWAPAKPGEEPVPWMPTAISEARE